VNAGAAHVSEPRPDATSRLDARRIIFFVEFGIPFFFNKVQLTFLSYRESVIYLPRGIMQAYFQNN
jgi:hypothetical protein